MVKLLVAASNVTPAGRLVASNGRIGDGGRAAVSLMPAGLKLASTAGGGGGAATTDSTLP